MAVDGAKRSPQLPPRFDAEAERKAAERQDKKFDALARSVHRAVTKAQSVSVKGLESLLADLPVKLEKSDILGAALAKDRAAVRELTSTPTIVLGGTRAFALRLEQAIERVSREHTVETMAFREPCTIDIHRIPKAREESLLASAGAVLLERPETRERVPGKLSRDDLYSGFTESEQLTINAAVNAIANLGLSDHAGLVATTQLPGIAKLLAGETLDATAEPKEVVRGLLRFVLASDIAKTDRYATVLASVKPQLEALQVELSRDVQPQPHVDVPACFTTALRGVSAEDASAIMRIVLALTHSSRLSDSGFKTKSGVSRETMLRLLSGELEHTPRPARQMIRSMLTIETPPQRTVVTGRTEEKIIYDMMGMPIGKERVPITVRETVGHFEELGLPSDWWAHTAMDRTAWHGLYQRFLNSSAAGVEAAPDVSEKKPLTFASLLAVVAPEHRPQLAECLAAVRVQGFYGSDPEFAANTGLAPEDYDAMLHGETRSSTVSAENLVAWAFRYVGQRKTWGSAFSETMSFDQSEIRSLAVRYGGGN